MAKTPQNPVFMQVKPHYNNYTTKCLRTVTISHNVVNLC